MLLCLGMNFFSRELNFVLNETLHLVRLNEHIGDKDDKEIRTQLYIHDKLFFSQIGY